MSPLVVRSTKNARLDVIRYAIDAVGGLHRFASLVDVKPERLSRWAEGGEPIPLDVFLDALDVIARGPYPVEPRVRVSVLPPE
jgi:hypothetical protein